MLNSLTYRDRPIDVDSTKDRKSLIGIPIVTYINMKGFYIHVNNETFITDIRLIVGLYLNIDILYFHSINVSYYFQGITQ